MNAKWRRIVKQRLLVVGGCTLFGFLSAGLWQFQLAAQNVEAPWSIALVADIIFLRMTLDRAHLEEVALREELHFVRSYLEIEQIRFEDRLSVRFDVAESVLDAAVPNLILQPIIENALTHAISRRIAPGWIRVAAVRAGDRLRLQVEDSGSEASTNAGEQGLKEGIGLSNTRARLDQMYGADYRLALGYAKGGGLCVELDLPYRHLAVEQADGVAHV